jgi:hypothetical protein
VPCLLLTHALKLTAYSGIYDRSYLAYIRAVLSSLPQHGLTRFVALHQRLVALCRRVRRTAWALEYVGFDLNALEVSGAAWLRGVCGGGHTEAERGLWPCGHQRLAAVARDTFVSLVVTDAVPRTCFWAGDKFAPKLRVRNSLPHTALLGHAGGCRARRWWPLCCAQFRGVLTPVCLSCAGVPMLHTQMMHDERAAPGIYRPSLVTWLRLQHWPPLG